MLKINMEQQALKEQQQFNTIINMPDLYLVHCCQPNADIPKTSTRTLCSTESAQRHRKSFGFWTNWLTFCRKWSAVWKWIRNCCRTITSDRYWRIWSEELISFWEHFETAGEPLVIRQTCDEWMNQWMSRTGTSVTEQDINKTTMDVQSCIDSIMQIVSDLNNQLPGNREEQSSTTTTSSTTTGSSSTSTQDMMSDVMENILSQFGR